MAGNENLLIKLRQRPTLELVNVFGTKTVIDQEGVLRLQLPNTVLAEIKGIVYRKDVADTIL